MRVDLSPFGTPMMGFGREFWFVAVAASMVLVIGLVWALFVRPKPRRRSRRHYYTRDIQPGTPEGTAEATPGESGRSRRRRRRRHRHRNATLAETGGLPPVREGDSSGAAG